MTMRLEEDQARRQVHTPEDTETQLASVNNVIIDLERYCELVPLYSMPTPKRNLYVELRKAKGSFEAEWDTIDRDQDMAIFDFAFGSVRTREKLRHCCIGLTGVLPDPNEFMTDFSVPMRPFSPWYKDDFRLRFCGAWRPGGDCLPRVSLLIGPA
ncbi:hypothetical protein KvSKV_09385 [Ketogulonicigenium vulgare]|uniref:Helicase n=2 Tax=Ketogulonicigenium vulgare TaxID=92945 RepID=F9Y8S4_KETVW|nr:helicase [Ketogulonicigenium vulgare]AEM41243.1 helicase [Ketogulonicigenium vulgare WSH-001]ALJ81384.1 hypothetical protein KVH_09435 [Ketogulonicigenium vulgare]ANW34112.1 hypothetical protein KvSKV_09385 [Ketogulonicigenium vulgare]